MFFGRGAFDPELPSGVQLLAHELTHVVQGYQGRIPAAAGPVRVSRPEDALEREAGAVEAEEAPSHGRPFSLALRLTPLGIVMLEAPSASSAAAG